MPTNTPTAVAADRPDAKRFSDILAVQRAAYQRDGAPSLTQRRQDLKKFKVALLARRGALEEAINTDFGNRSRHETAMMEVLGVVQGRWNSISLLQPPYGKRAEALLDFFLR